MVCVSHFFMMPPDVCSSFRAVVPSLGSLDVLQQQLPEILTSTMSEGFSSRTSRDPRLGTPVLEDLTEPKLLQGNNNR